MGACSIPSAICAGPDYRGVILVRAKMGVHGSGETAWLILGGTPLSETASTTQNSHSSLEAMNVT